MPPAMSAIPVGPSSFTKPDTKKFPHKVEVFSISAVVKNVNLSMGDGMPLKELMGKAIQTMLWITVNGNVKIGNLKVDGVWCSCSVYFKNLDLSLAFNAFLCGLLSSAPAPFENAFSVHHDLPKHLRNLPAENRIIMTLPRYHSPIACYRLVTKNIGPVFAMEVSTEEGVTTAKILFTTDEDMEKALGSPPNSLIDENQISPTIPLTRSQVELLRNFFWESHGIIVEEPVGFGNGEYGLRMGLMSQLEGVLEWEDDVSVGGVEGISFVAKKELWVDPAVVPKCAFRIERSSLLPPRIRALYLSKFDNGKPRPIPTIPIPPQPIPYMLTLNLAGFSETWVKKVLIDQPGGGGSAGAVAAGVPAVVPGNGGFQAQRPPPAPAPAGSLPAPNRNGVPGGVQPFPRFPTVQSQSAGHQPHTMQGQQQQQQHRHQAPAPKQGTRKLNPFGQGGFGGTRPVLFPQPLPLSQGFQPGARVQRSPAPSVAGSILGVNPPSIASAATGHCPDEMGIYEEMGEEAAAALQELGMNYVSVADEVIAEGPGGGGRWFPNGGRDEDMDMDHGGGHAGFAGAAPEGGGYAGVQGAGWMNGGMGGMGGMMGGMGGMGMMQGGGGGGGGLLVPNQGLQRRASDGEGQAQPPLFRIAFTGPGIQRPSSAPPHNPFFQQ